MNKIVVSGRLTRDVELRKTPSGKSVAGFTLAVDRPFLNQQGQREADFIPVMIWGKAAEVVSTNCHKGSRLLVEGRLQIRNFDAKDGTKHWVTEIIASGFEFLDPRAKKTGDTPATEAPAEVVTTEETPANTANAEEFPF